MAVSLVRVLRRAEPVEIAVDGHPRRLWLGFVGNGHYRPSGFAPTWRERLDDGRLDLRLVDAELPLARIRLLLAVLTGRLGRSAVYIQRDASQVTFDGDGSSLRFALDGEVRDLPPGFTIAKRSPTLVVFAPHR